MLCIVMVVILSTTLAGCRGCTSNDEEVRWIPTPTDVTVRGEFPEPIDSLDMITDEIVDNTVESTPKTIVASDTKRKAKVRVQPPTQSYTVKNDSYIRLEDYTRDPVQLTIILPDVEIQITKGHSD